MPRKFSLIFILIAIVVVGGFLLSYQKKVSFFSNSDEENNSQKISFLLLGKTGKIIGWNQSPDLTDTIMVVEYNPQIGAANIVSLPRDLYVNLDGENLKLNEAEKKGKLLSLLIKLPEITGIKTDKYLVVDIDILKKVVDELGGIDIELNLPLIDWVSGYKIDAGKQHLNGDQAVFVARNRFAPEGDFFREKNQQLIIKSIIEKFRKLNIIEKTSFLFNLIPEFAKLETNINFQELTPFVNKFSSVRFNDVVLDFSTGLLVSSSTSIGYGTSTAYILIPKEGINEYSKIKGFIQTNLEK